MDFARRLARRLGLPFVECIRTLRKTEPQKTRANSFQQAQNLVGAFIVDEAMVASDRVFDAPPQPVTCELQTSGGPMKVGGTFAPHVVFKEGFAVDASPGLANITGVNSYLAMPIVAYVNRAASIKSEMSAIINALRARANSRQAAR